ncbi:ABC transporter substrate-binding protein [Candidatus Pantoea multigeneris]|uniref:ABC transporter substrate-binding protein n=1 Tax=Candidatus Pantoea multigeneris TaxID=2608357 RepID=UPI0019633DD3|nr:ABC transporter substrate-binding protein [Pantoea multigeneris]
MAFEDISLSRRTLLHGLATLGVGIGLSPVFTGTALADNNDKTLKTIKLAWGQSAVCQAPISVALKQGFFKKYGLNVEPVNFSGPTDALLQAIATGQADGGIGMALRWLKPLEQGFDVDLTVGTHGGCMRLLAPKDSGINKVSDLVGKNVAVSDQASPIRNFFAIQLAKEGIDPDKQVNWLQYPEDLFGEALRKGEVQALATDDPQGWLLKHQHDLVEVSNNMHGEYMNMTCCVLGLRGSLVRDNPEVAKAITQAIVDAQQWTADHPDETAKIFQPYVPGSVPVASIAAMLKEHTHSHHSTGAQLRGEIATYVNELKTINVIRPDTNAQQFADHYVPNLLPATPDNGHQHMNMSS